MGGMLNSNYSTVLTVPIIMYEIRKLFENSLEQLFFGADRKTERFETGMIIFVAGRPPSSSSNKNDHPGFKSRKNLLSKK